MHDPVCYAITGRRSDDRCLCVGMSSTDPHNISQSVPKTANFKTVSCLYKVDVVRACPPGYTTWQACMARLSSKMPKGILGDASSKHPASVYHDTTMTMSG
jgi:hypothetical protein